MLLELRWWARFRSQDAANDRQRRTQLAGSCSCSGSLSSRTLLPQSHFTLEQILKSTPLYGTEFVPPLGSRKTRYHTEMSTPLGSCSVICAWLWLVSAAASSRALGSWRPSCGLEPMGILGRRLGWWGLWVGPITTQFDVLHPMHGRLKLIWALIQKPTLPTSASALIQRWSCADCPKPFSNMQY